MSSTEQPLIDLHSNGLDPVPAAPKDALAVAEGAGDGGHVLTVVAKRMRAAKKKLTRIEGIEKNRQEGKAINADQASSSLRNILSTPSRCVLKPSPQPCRRCVPSDLQSKSAVGNAAAEFCSPCFLVVLTGWHWQLQTLQQTLLPMPYAPEARPEWPRTREV